MKFKDKPFFWLVVGFLATWRITNALQREEIASPIRKAVGIIEPDGEDPDYWIYPDSWVGKLFHCFWCGSQWIAVGITITLFIFPPLIIPFALSALAIGFKEWMDKPPAYHIQNLWAGEDVQDNEVDDLGEEDV